VSSLKPRIKINFFLLATSTLAFFIALYFVARPTKFWGRAFGTNANLVVDAGSSYDVGGGSWRSLAQGGEENGRMLAAVVSDVSALNPSYIRIDHVFDYYGTVERGSDGSLSFNWTKLDHTLDDIKSIGAVPFISLSYMPPAISGGDVNSLPKDWSEWEKAVRNIIEHVSSQSGGFDQVYYEVWNEPDLFGGFKTRGEKNYLELYDHSARAAQSAMGVKSFKLGGPATTGAYTAWIEDLLTFCLKNNLRIDFVSWHRYSVNIADYESDAFDIKRILQEKFPQYNKLELIVSEVGPDSENNKIYDSTVSAFHTIATAASLEGTVDKIFTFEIKDGIGPEKYWGRWGLLTNDKWGAPEKKPRYSALTFLNKMSGNKVNVSGQGSWVKSFAKEENGKIKVLVVNYDPHGRHYESVPINLINLPFKKFSVSRTNLFGYKVTQEVSIEATTWQTTEGFDANSAAIFEIAPM